MHDCLAVSIGPVYSYLPQLTIYLSLSSWIKRFKNDSFIKTICGGTNMRRSFTMGQTYLVLFFKSVKKRFSTNIYQNRHKNKQQSDKMLPKVLVKLLVD